jgi:nuclear mRNA export protein PCID2/THP1
MSTYTLDAFWSDLNATLTGNNQRLTFTQLFTLNFLKLDPVRIGSFQVHLQQFDNKALSKLVDNNPTMKRIEWHALENFVLKYLICIRDFDPWSVIKSIDLFISVFECEALLLNTKNNDIYDKIGRIVLPCFAETMSLMVPLCEVIDIESMHIHNR